MTLSHTLAASARLAELPAEVQDAVRADREQAEQRARDETLAEARRMQALVNDAADVAHRMMTVIDAANKGAIEDWHVCTVREAGKILARVGAAVKEATDG